MDGPVLQTILAGVTVFVLGQFIVRLLLDSLVRFKEALGEVSALFLRFQAKISNATGGVEIAEQIKHAGSRLLALKQAVPFYGAICFVSRLPNSDSLICGCRSLNFIASAQITGDCVGVEAEMSKIEGSLGIRVRYAKG